jgi:hypothetical protein
MTQIQHHRLARRELQLRLEVRTVVSQLSDKGLDPATRESLRAMLTQLTKELHQC